MADCLFCRILAGEIPSDEVASSEHGYAFRDIAPAAPTHVLVIPRVHIESADAVGAEHAQIVADLFALAQRVAELEDVRPPERGYRIVMNVGPDALNSVPHLHMHVLGGRGMTWPPG